MLSYALVTPARDEAENLSRLAPCLAEQTLAPLEWVIVDDGSTDGTRDVAAVFAEQHPWVRVLDSPGPSSRQGPLNRGRGAGRDMIAFKAGAAALVSEPDVIVKLDADVSFAPDYFERIMREFSADPSLGITGGVCYEQEANGEWRPYHVTGDHVRGATRSYRRACFDDVSPLQERIGWDMVDEVTARLRGWSTRTMADLVFYHHRRLGERDGSKGAWILQGELAHWVGYRFSYMTLRALFRARREPAALAMVWGYLHALWRREPRYADANVRAYVREGQRMRNLPIRMTQALGRRA